MNRKRVEAEIVRDLHLAVAGQLDRRVGGRSVFPPIPADVAAQSYANNHAYMHRGVGLCETDSFPGGVTNGAKWYKVQGGMQDFNYVFSNAMEVTVEVSCCKYPLAVDLQGQWEANKDSLVTYLEKGEMDVGNCGHRAFFQFVS